MIDYLPPMEKVSAGMRHGRDVQGGYQRGWGLQYAGLAEKVQADSLFQESVGLAQDRSLITPANAMNLFLLIKFFLPRIPFGHIVEFGAYKGGSAIFMANICRRILPGVQVYAFDTFEGMPQTNAEIDSHSSGDFRNTSVDEIRAYAASNGLDNLVLVPGLFEDTAPMFLPNIKSIALAHIDCDIKSAVAFSYDAAKPYMVERGYFVFDDALTSSCLGATEAVEELVIQRDHRLSEQVYPQYVFRA